MSESKQRTIEEIQADYQRTCVQAGHIQYQITTLEGDLKLVNDTLRSLNVEAAASKKASDEAAKVSE